MWYLAGLYLTGWMLSKSLILQRVSLFRNNSVFNRTISIRTESNLSTPLRGRRLSKSIINERNKIMLSCMRWDTQIPPRSGFHAQSQRWTNRVRNQSPDEIWKNGIFHFSTVFGFDILRSKFHTKSGGTKSWQIDSFNEPSDENQSGR